MIRNKLLGIGLIITLIIGVSFIGCGGDDDDDTAGGSGGTGTTPGNNNTFTGVLRSNLDETEIPNATVKALDNATLEELGSETVTGLKGEIELKNLPAGEVCIFALGNTGGDLPIIDTYTYNVESNEQNRDIYAIPVSVAEMIDGALCGPNDPTMGGASGGVYYKNEAGDEFTLGCATVEVEPSTESTVVYYFQGGLPSVGDQNEPCDKADIGAGRILETSANGRFYATNMPEGMVTLTAYVKGQAIGSTTLKVTLPQNSTGGLYNSNITRIYADAPGNPAPDCVAE